METLRERYMQTDLHRQQYGEMRRLLGNIQRRLEPLNAEEIRANLACLDGILTIPTAMNDKGRGHGKLAAALRAFCEKWLERGAIESKSAYFTASYRALAQAFHQDEPIDLAS